MASIKDVAAAAGVSLTTVSHALNNRGRIAQKTRIRVLEAARDLGYQANVHAQQLVTRRSRIIAIQMPTPERSQGPALPHSAYFLDLINGASAAADEARYALVVTPSGSKANILDSFAIDGAIIVDPHGNEPAFDTGAPIVTIGDAHSGSHDDVLAVDNDHAAAAHIVLDHFAALGRTRPAVVADSTHWSYVNEVLAGYRSWARQQGIPEAVITLECPEGGRVDQTVQQLLADGVDAVYTSSDELALALLDAAVRARVRVPEQLAIASAVDSRSLTLTTPQISATNLFPFRTGEIAAQLLIERLEHGPEPVHTQLIATQFVARGSSALP